MNPDWSAGYVVDTGYLYGYFHELNPLRARLALLAAGYAAPEKSQSACELGFGQGISINIHAAANAAIAHWGADFNPTQASFARGLASASGSNARLFDESFAEFAARSDLPDLDFVGLHGIWSWVTPEVRGNILEILRRKLKPGGVAYISYNTLPGWSGDAPLQHLLSHHAAVTGRPGDDAPTKVAAALEFTGKLLELNPNYLRHHPAAKEQLKRMQKHDRRYLAHEFLNQAWEPQYFSEVADQLAGVKLQFAAHAGLLDHVETLNVDAKAQAFLAAIPDPGLRETARDYFLNRRFRRDYWVKGAQPLAQADRLERIRAMRFVLSTPRAKVPMKIPSLRGEAALSAPVYQPLLDALADRAGAAKTFGDLEKQVEAHNKGGFPHMLEAILILVGAGHLQPAQPDDQAVEASREACRKLNRALMEKARFSDDIQHLASPVTGGGIGVGRFGQLFLLARESGKESPDDWGRFAWEALEKQKQRVLVNGKALATPAENIAELTRRAKQFSEGHLPTLKALGVA